MTVLSLMTNEQVAYRWPGLWGQFEATARTMQRWPALACWHVIEADEEGMICAAHPASGVLCSQCSTEHGDRHTEATDRTCDSCGQVSPWLQPLVQRVGPVRAQSTSGATRTLGVVLLGWLGLCRDCLGDVVAA